MMDKHTTVLGIELIYRVRKNKSEWGIEQLTSSTKLSFGKRVLYVMHKGTFWNLSQIRDFEGVEQVRHQLY